MLSLQIYNRIELHHLQIIKLTNIVQNYFNDCGLSET